MSTPSAKSAFNQAVLVLVTKRKSRSKKYTYYFCYKKGCLEKNKNILWHKLEVACEALLGRVEPDESVFNVAIAMFKDCWNQI